MPPIVIGAAIAGAAGIGSAVIQSRAAGKASEQQAEGGQAALDLQREIYQQQRADLAPYRDLGASATRNLSGLMGFTPGAGAAGPMASQAGSAVDTVRRRGDQPISGWAVPRPAGQPAVPPQGGWANLRNMSQGQAPGQAQTRSSFTRIKAPNGQVYNIPPDQVERALAEGGVRV